MPLKDSISTPLEAGTSILDTHNLPPHLNDALEYASRRLARKSLHVPLVAIHRDYQIPPDAQPVSPPASPPPSVGPRTGFAASLRQRLNPILTSFSLSTSREGNVRSTATSPTCSVSSGASGWSKPSWPGTPGTPATPMSVPPMTPSAASPALTDTGPPTPGPCGIRLVHGDVTCPKNDQKVRDVFDKARRKYGLGTDWLPAPRSPSAHSFPEGPIRRSLLQNDILFSSEGLTLYSLDRLYTFKSALSSYSRSRSPLRLEDAVDELRRLYLASGSRPVARGRILRSYDWLGVSEAALAEVDRMYKRAYGGADGKGAIEELRVVEEELTEEEEEEEEELGEVVDWKMEEAELPMMLFPNSPIETLTPLCRAPALRLQTTFDARGGANNHRPPDGDEEDEEDLTARPEHQDTLWTASIDEVISPKTDRSHHLRPGSEQSEKLGPITPRVYEDISPVTRGEWGFLFSDARLGGRTAAVETCWGG